MSMWIEGIGNDVLCRSSKIKGVSNFLLDYIKKSKESNCGTALTSLGQHPQRRCHKDVTRMKDTVHHKFLLGFHFSGALSCWP